MVQEDVPTMQVPQFNDSSNTVSSSIIFQKPKDKLCHVPDCIAATMVQEDVPTTLAPTQAPQQPTCSPEAGDLATIHAVVKTSDVYLDQCF